MKILSIGNSYSQDAHKLLAPLAAAYGDEVYAVSLYHSSQPLEVHWNNYLSGEEIYDYVVNGDFLGKAAFLPTLLAEDWDIVTLQQVSQVSGHLNTYYPYVTDLYNVIQKHRPNSKIILHKTWAYEIDSTHAGFANYDRSQDKMYAALDAAYEHVAKDLNCPMIRVGDVIQHLRHNCPEFDYANGGLSLCRDGFHLTKTYGRYAAALAWYKFLFGKDISQIRYIPEEKGVPADTKLLQIIHDAVQTVIG